MTDTATPAEVSENAPQHAAIYVRISQDRDDVQLGVQRQETACRELADRKGWRIAELYTDNDTSAYTGKPRKDYLRMLADLEDGIRDGVIVLDQDRLVRHTRELEDFIDLCDKLGIPLANVTGDIDFSTSDGRYTARQRGAVARWESEKKSERLKRERAQRAQDGKPHPGPRGFGYELGYESVREDEARLIRQAAHEILQEGKSLRQIAIEWNNAEITTARGSRWTVSAVRDMLINPRIAGLRTHHREIIGQGNWTPILNMETWQALVEQADGRKRKMGRPPTSLLSGVLVCGICKQPMNKTKGKDSDVYACRRTRPGKGEKHCGRVSIKRDATDEEVRDRVLHALASDGFRTSLTQIGDDADERERLAKQLYDEEAALTQLHDDFYVERILDRKAFLTTRAKLEERITTIQKELDAKTDAQRGMIDSLPTAEDALRAWWDAVSTDQRRAVVQLVTQRIIVHPYSPDRPRRFDPQRIETEWIV